MPSVDPVIGNGASTVSSSINLIKTIIGAGLLSMPLAYSTDGSIFGTFIILVAAITSGFGLVLQALVSKFAPVGNATFYNLCQITYPQLSVIFDIAIAIQCFGCAVSYLVLIGDLMPTIVTHIPHVAERHHRLFWLVASTIATVPLSFLKNLDSLKYTSILGLVAVAYLTLFVVGHWFANDIPRNGIISYWPSSTTAVFSTFSIIVFAFTGHQNMFSIINEARDKSIGKLVSLINFAIVLAALLFIIVGLTGYLTFGANVSGNIILMYPANWATTLGRFCIVFMVLFSFPLMLHPARISVNNVYFAAKKKFIQVEERVNETTQLLQPDTSVQNENEIDPELQMKEVVVPFPRETFIGITITLLVVGYFLAITVKSFAFILAIVGATGSTSISFILPGLFGYKLIGSEVDASKAEKAVKYLSLSLTVWGVIVMFVCLYSSFAL